MIIERRFLSNSGQVNLGPQFSGEMMSFVVCEGKIIINPCVEGELCGYARRANRYGHVITPRDAIRESGISYNDYIDMGIDGFTITLSKVGEMGKATETLTEHVLELEPQLTYMPTKDAIPIEINCGKQLRLPEWVLNRMGLEYNSLVVVKVNNNQGVWLEMYRATGADLEIETRANAVARYRNHIMKFDGLRYIELMNGSKIHIPPTFLNIFGGDRRVNIWLNDEKKCLVIEGQTRQCDLCTDDVRSLPTALVDVQLCPECMPPDGKSQTEGTAPPSPSAPPTGQTPPPTSGDDGKSIGAALVEQLKKVGEDQNLLLQKLELLGSASAGSEISELELDDNAHGNGLLGFLGLTPRTFNMLRRKGIDTITGLCSYTPEDLMKFKGFGMGALDEVRRKLEKRGLALASN